MHTGLITIEPARKSDLPAVVALLQQNGLPDDGLAEHFETTWVARRSGEVVGCVALEIYADGALLRSLAVQERLRGNGLGERLTRAALDHAKEAGVSDVYLLTETAGGFFPRFGFHSITRADVPASVRQSVEFISACAESALAMTKHL
jgi:amino-acid N-acetyltransferase